MATSDPAPTPEPANTPEGPRPIEDLSLDELLNVTVVTASGGRAENRATAAANVVSISREQIELHGWRSLAEALTSVPGLYVVDDPVLPSIGVRGVSGGLRAGTRIVKVMIDGVVVSFRPDLTAFLGPEYIPIEAVERIEIAKGPLSALYGANAFLATVNVITRVPAEREGIASLRLNHAGASIGHGVSALTSVGDDRAGILLSVSTDRVDRSGLEIEKTFDAQDPSLARYAPFFDDESRNDLALPVAAFARAHRAVPALGRLQLSGGFQRRDTNAEFAINSVHTHRSRIALENSWTNLGWDRNFGSAVGATASLGYSEGGPSRDTRLYLTDNENYEFRPNFYYRAFNGEAEVSFRPGERFGASLGVDAEQNTERVLFYTQRFLVPEGSREAGDEIDQGIGADDRCEETLRNLGVHAQITGAPLGSMPGLRLTGDVRVDQIRYGDIEYDPQLSWRAAVVQKWGTSTVTKAIAGEAFQTPSGVLMFARTGFGNGNRILGNAVQAPLLGLDELRPQKVRSVELVMSTGLFRLVALEADVFYQVISDKIEFIREAQDFIAINRGTATYLGAETSIRLATARVSPYFTVSAVEDMDEEELFRESAHEIYPKLHGAAGVDLDFSRWHLIGNVEVRMVGPRGASQSNEFLNNEEQYNLDGYTKVDATLSTTGVRLFPAGQESRIVIGARNLTDVKHSEPGFSGFDVPALGRVVFAELRQSF